MPANLSIRAARPEDAKSLCPMAIASKALWGYSEEQMEIFREELTFSGEQLVDLMGHVAELNGELVGYYTLVAHFDDEIELEHLFVDSKHLKEGIGRQLLEHAIEFSRDRGHRRMKIISDPNAELFYIKSGAHKIGDHQSSIPGRTIPILEIRL